VLSVCGLGGLPGPPGKKTFGQWGRFGRNSNTTGHPQLETGECSGSLFSKENISIHWVFKGPQGGGPGQTLALVVFDELSRDPPVRTPVVPTQFNHWPG